MISMENFKEADLGEIDAISLVKEEDFLHFANKPENQSYRFAEKELHPNSEEEKIIAHSFYVFDVASKQWFNYQEVLIDKEEYQSLQDEEED
jgi:hypothetical protein